MTKMNFFAPYSDRHHFLNPIRGYDNSIMMIGLFKMETSHQNSFYINVSFFWLKLSPLFMPIRSICSNFSTLVIEVSWDLKYGGFSCSLNWLELLT